MVFSARLMYHFPMTQDEHTKRLKAAGLDLPPPRDEQPDVTRLSAEELKMTPEQAKAKIAELQKLAEGK